MQSLLAAISQPLFCPVTRERTLKPLYSILFLKDGLNHIKA